MERAQRTSVPPAIKDPKGMTIISNINNGNAVVSLYNVLP